jgi:hypothetical protein
MHGDDDDDDELFWIRWLPADSHHASLVILLTAGTIGLCGGLCIVYCVARCTFINKEDQPCFPSRRSTSKQHAT